MCDCMIFPETVEEFIEQYKLKDDKEIYTNGVDLIPVFRIKQWMYHHMTPAADVEEVRRGEWIYGEFDISHCSECGYEITPNMISPYCPNCGAKMDGGNNNA